MERITIAEVTRYFDSILQILDNAYWEACHIAEKDVFYDIISTLHLERNELAKLSIEDHYLAYEPITSGFRHSQQKLKKLQSNLPSWVNRATTAEKLEEELPNIIALLNLSH